MLIKNTPYQKCVLIGVITPDIDEKKAIEHIDELEFLAHTAHLQTQTKFFQKIITPNSKTFIGEGKLYEIKNYIAEHEIKIAVFDDELSGTQLRNIEKILKCKVIDRTTLILNIFAMRAKTAYAKIQVELAQYEYMLPRLTRLWTHLERQQGGIGMRGPGEKELETDKRVIKKRISLLKEQLKKIDIQMNTQRQQRKQWVRVALVGYTNVGKSTLMNLLSKSNVFAENKLFATLDTTVRKVVINNVAFLLSDTVGFIRKLPHHLFESFKSTLDELKEADIILHVIDISHPAYNEHIKVVNKTLVDIGVLNKPIIHIFNKADLLSTEELVWIQNEQKINTDSFTKTSQNIFISALKKENIDLLRNTLYHNVKEIYRKRYPFENFLYPDI
ncbi:MAG: GTPase HflX [Bacteroidales bacterium]